MEPRSVTFNSVNKNAVSSIIRVYTYVTDGNRRQINLNGTDTGFSLLLKSKVSKRIYMKPYEFERFNFTILKWVNVCISTKDQV